MILSQLKKALRRFYMYSATKSNYKFILKDWTSLTDLNALSEALKTKRFSQNVEPIVMASPKAKRCLVIAPHPDDDVLSSGGTLLKLRDKGCKVEVVYLTSGCSETYSDKEARVMTDMALRVEDESKNISKKLGSNVEFMRYSNGAIKIDGEVMDKIKDIYKTLRPNVVFIPFIADDRDDHRRTAQLFYELFKKEKDLNFEVWAYQVYSTLIPNVVVDISDQMDEKTKLVNMWDSRKESRDWAHYVRGVNAANSRFLKTNKSRYAELFFVVPAKEYVELCGKYFGAPSSELYYSESYK